MKLSRARELFKEFSSKNVLVIGDIMLDKYLWGNATRISPEAPVPVVTVNKTSFTPGGAGNVALNLSGLGCKVEIAGILGDDEPGRQLKQIFNSRNIETSGLVTDRYSSTTVKTRVIAQEQQVVRIDQESTDAKRNDLLDEFYNTILLRMSHIDAIILQDYNKGLLSENLIQKIISGATALNVPIYVDPKKDHFDIYRNIRLFKPNLSEFRAGIGKHVEGVQFFEEGNVYRVNQNIDLLVVTRGAEGISIFSDKGVHTIPTKARKVHDVSGAGDTVISVFSLSDLSGATPEEAAALANYGAGRVCEEVGVVPITIDMLSGYIEEHNSN